MQRSIWFWCVSFCYPIAASVSMCIYQWESRGHAFLTLCCDLWSGCNRRLPKIVSWHHLDDYKNRSNYMQNSMLRFQSWMIYLQSNQNHRFKRWILYLNLNLIDLMLWYIKYGIFSSRMAHLMWFKVKNNSNYTDM